MEKREAKKRVVLVPFLLHGHVTPMIQLGKALNLKGFSITVVLADSIQESSLQHLQGFQYVTIPKSLPESELETLGPMDFLLKLNRKCEANFKNCISKMLLQQGNDIGVVIYDEFFYSCGDAAKEFKLPSVSFTVGSATNQFTSYWLSKFSAEKFLVDMTDPELQEKVVENMHGLKYKDISPLGFGPLEPFLVFIKELANKRSSSAVVINSAICLESMSLSLLQQDLKIPVYALGPLHITASDNRLCLPEENRSCIEWLNKQKPRSVIYISFGSMFSIETKEILEMAWGLSNSKQPFLWVMRTGSEIFPEEIIQMVSQKGYIVKWAPQLKVLAHPAIGGFWTHCGWNSTLESLVEGVPMICRPIQGEHKIYARYIKSVWSVGFKIEGEVERGCVEKAVKRLIVDEEGAIMREKALGLKEKLKASVTIGGSSYNALDELVKLLEEM